MHRLVAAAFVENPHGKPLVNHLNGIRDDNRAENLEWCTQSENVRHGFRVLGRVPTKPNLGKASLNRKLTDEQAEAIRKDPRNQYVIAAEYGVNQRVISDIKLGKSYTTKVR